MKFFTLTMAALVLGGMFLFPKDAHAYLDPGTGSYILQLLIASLIGGLFVIKTYFQKIKSFFIKSPVSNECDEQQGKE